MHTHTHTHTHFLYLMLVLCSILDYQTRNLGGTHTYTLLFILMLVSWGVLNHQTHNVISLKKKKSRIHFLFRFMSCKGQSCDPFVNFDGVVTVAVGACKIHHHHVTLQARISLTDRERWTIETGGGKGRHPSLSSIAPGWYSRQHPVSAQSCCI